MSWARSIPLGGGYRLGEATVVVLGGGILAVFVDIPAGHGFYENSNNYDVEMG